MIKRKIREGRTMMRTKSETRRNEKRKCMVPRERNGRQETKDREGDKRKERKRRCVDGD